MPTYITTKLNQLATQYPHQRAIVCGNKQLTYHELNQLTNQLATYLASQGITSGDTIGLLLPNCVSYPACFIAPLRIGAISVPLNPRYRSTELAAIFQEIQIAVLITTIDQVNRVKPLLQASPTYKLLLVVESLSEQLGNGSAIQPSYQPQPTDVATYIYTSGTTGLPKGVILTHDTIAQRGANKRNLTVTRTDRCYTLGGLSHNGKLFVGLIWSLYAGMTFYTDATFHPQQTLHRLITHKITLLHASPFHLAILAHWDGLEDVPALPALKLCLSSGNRVSDNVVNRFQARFGVTVTQNYGITEAGGLCTDGWPHPGVQFNIVDEITGQPLPSNQLGEVVVTSKEVAPGYLNRPDLTATRFKAGWFCTGDLGYLDKMGRLSILCRQKNRFLIAGYPIYPDEIQAVLTKHSQVVEALVKKDKDDRLMAYVMVSEPVSTETLLRFCQAQLPPHKVPAEIIKQDQLPFPWLKAMQQEDFDWLS